MILQFFTIPHLPGVVNVSLLACIANNGNNVTLNLFNILGSQNTNLKCHFGLTAIKPAVGYPPAALMLLSLAKAVHDVYADKTWSAATKQSWTCNEISWFEQVDVSRDLIQF